jgi:hypothetical protein
MNLARRSLAERLQAGLDKVPLTPKLPPELPRPRNARADRVVAVLASVAIVIPLLMIPYGIVSGNWWRTESTVTCTVEDYRFHETYSKSGNGVVYDVHTVDCGQLQVTSGGAIKKSDVIILGDSLRSGDRYRFELRGWVGWPNVPRAIVAASDVTAGD